MACCCAPPCVNAPCCDCLSQISGAWPSSLTVEVTGTFYWDQHPLFGCTTKTVTMDSTYTVPFTQDASNDPICAVFSLLPPRLPDKTMNQYGVSQLTVLLSQKSLGTYQSGYIFKFVHPCSTGGYFIGPEIRKQFGQSGPGDPSLPQPGGVFYNCREAFWLSQQWSVSESGAEFNFGRRNEYSYNINVRITAFNYNPLP